MKNHLFRAFSLFSLLLVTAATAPAQTVTYNASADFTPGLSNPNGVWFYGYTANLAGTLTPFADYTFNSSAQVYSWSTNLSLGAPAIFFNFGTSALNGLPPNQLALHPGPSGEYAVLRFTAPADGNYGIAAQFFSGDAGGTDATILVNGQASSSIFFAADTGSNPAFSGSVTLNLGDRLDFAVGAPSSFFFGTTPLAVVLTFTPVPVPEPGTGALFVLGAPLVLAWSLRRRHS